MTWYHGGIGGMQIGDVLVPSPPHVDDGCPVCVARAAGMVVTVGEYRTWLRLQGPRALPVLKMLEGAPADAPVDPPTQKRAVYFTTYLAYARWYAARSRGDLYEVRPVGSVERSKEDHFPTWTAGSAIVSRVVERRVRLTRKDRREIAKRWKRMDKECGK
jgi:hypothetical protein